MRSMTRNRTYTLVMAPGQHLDVLSPDVAAAIAVAREALVYLQGSAYDAAMAATLSFQEEQVDEAWCGRYVLTCLFCGLVHPTGSGTSDLVAMQEHHMEAHGFQAEDFSVALRVNRSGDSTHFIWALPPAMANVLGLTQVCYLRAVKLTEGSSQSENGPKVVGGSYIWLVHRPSESSALTLQEVRVTTQDGHAWYGWPRGKSEQGGEPLVWPKGEWESADEGGAR
jgi:hypothetical protein